MRRGLQSLQRHSHAAHPVTHPHPSDLVTEAIEYDKVLINQPVLPSTTWSCVQCQTEPRPKIIPHSPGPRIGRKHAQCVVSTREVRLPRPKMNRSNPKPTLIPPMPETADGSELHIRAKRDQVKSPGRFRFAAKTRI